MTTSAELKRKEPAAQESEYQLGDVVHPFASGFEIVNPDGFGGTDHEHTNSIPANERVAKAISGVFVLKFDGKKLRLRAIAEPADAGNLDGSIVLYDGEHATTEQAPRLFKVRIETAELYGAREWAVAANKSLTCELDASNVRCWAWRNYAYQRGAFDLDRMGVEDKKEMQPVRVPAEKLPAFGIKFRIVPSTPE